MSLYVFCSFTIVVGIFMLCNCFKFFLGGEWKKDRAFLFKIAVFIFKWYKDLVTLHDSYLPCAWGVDNIFTNWVIDYVHKHFMVDKHTEHFSYLSECIAVLQNDRYFVLLLLKECCCKSSLHVNCAKYILCHSFQLLPKIPYFFHFSDIYTELWIYTNGFKITTICLLNFYVWR